MKHRGAKRHERGLNLALPNTKVVLSPSNYLSSLGFLAEVLSKFSPSPTTGENPGEMVTEQLFQPA